MTQQTMRQLLIFGVLLFLFGLLNGAVIPYFTNPRMGLSAHLAGVQNGMVLLIFGLLWPYLTLSSTTLDLSGSSVGHARPRARSAIHCYPTDVQG